MLIALAGLLAACSNSAHPGGGSGSGTGASIGRARPHAASPQPARSATGPATGTPSPVPDPSPSAAAGYRTYASPRFGFTTLRPSSFRAQPPAADGGGQAWTSPDGRASLAAYGADNIFGFSPRQDETAISHNMAVVYRNISGNIVTVSGYRDDGRTIVYERDVVGTGAIDTLYWAYPASQKARWNTAVTATAQAFQPGDVAIGH